MSRYLSILTQPFLPFSAQRLWSSGESGEVAQERWNLQSIGQLSTNGVMKNQLLIQRLDLDEILSQEKSFAEDSSESSDSSHSVKGGKKKKRK